MGTLACEDDSCEIDRTSLLQLQQLQRASNGAATQAQSDCFHSAGGCGFSSDSLTEREQKKAEREQKKADRDQKKAEREQKKAERERKKAERDLKNAEENVEVEATTTTPAAGRAVVNRRPSRPKPAPLPPTVPPSGKMEVVGPPGGALRAARWGYSETEVNEDLAKSTECKTCSEAGDPHITTFDAVDGHRNKDFYNFGDYWIVKSRLIGIQGRYWSDRTDGHAAIRELAIIDPNSDNVIIVKPLQLANGPATLLNGEALEEDVESDWMTHTILTLDQMGDAVNNGKKKKKNKQGALIHKFTIHGSGEEEKEEVSVEVHQLGKTISVIIKMWDF